MELDFSTSVDVVDEITPHEFREKYLLPEKPVVIRKLWQDYPAVTKWTFDYFKQELGTIEVGLFTGGEGYNDRSFKTPHQKMNFGDYLDLIRSKPTNLRIFLFNIFKHKPELRKDFDFPPLSKGYLRRFPFMFFGGKNSSVRIHQDMDMSNVFLTQLHGSKRVVLFSPKYSDLLYRYPYTVHSKVNIDRPDFKKHPGLRFVKGLQCTINHGETLFIPSGWWHYITYLEGGFAISQRAFSPHWIRRIEGFWKVIVLSSFDDLMRLLLRNIWFEYKEKKTEQRAKSAISMIENEQLVTSDFGEIQNSVLPEI